MKEILLVLFFSFCFNLPVTFSASNPVIVVLLSKSIKPYNDALSGFDEDIKKSGYKIAVIYNLDEKKDNQPQLISIIKDQNPELVFTIGTEAAIFAKQNLNDLPVVFSMILNPVKSGIARSVSGPGNNLTGVSLDIPPELQFRKLKEVLPKVTRVGVIYNAKEKEWIKGIEAAAQKNGLSVIAKPVNSQSDVPGRLDEIVKEVDCLWAQVDPMIYNVQSSQYILLNLLRSKVPMMAFSAQYVKAGALLALECDYVDIGRQSAGIAVTILKHGAFGNIALVFPQKERLLINKEIAGVIGVDIPQKALEEAAQIY
jgi:putative ABC transport system substrate-binding protein